MPRFASAEDRTLQSAIDDWKLTAADEVDDIGAWRDNTAERAKYLDEPKNFYSLSTYLSGSIVTQFPQLDPKPIQDVYQAIAAWYADHDASRIPPQAVLFATMERAMMTLQSVEAAIYSRSDFKKPVKAARTISVPGVSVPHPKWKGDPQSWPDWGKVEPHVGSYGDHFLRDVWIYVQRKNGRTKQDIADQLLKGVNKWDIIGSIGGISNCSNRVARFLKWPLIRGHAGRPSSSSS